MKKLQFSIAGLSDVGTRKDINEDAFVYKVADTGSHFAAIVAVADGVGGLHAGEKASSMAISNINRWWETGFRQNYEQLDAILQTLLEFFYATNTTLLAMAKQEGGKMATTLSVLLFYKDSYHILHVGDSRIYKVWGMGGRSCQQLTQDHSRSVPRQTPHGVQNKMMLTECLGNKEQFTYFYDTGKLRKEDLFFVCSDGIYKTLSAQEIAATLSRHKGTLALACEELVQRTKKNGETDNITAVAARIQ